MSWGGFEGLFQERFGFLPNDVQKCMLEKDMIARADREAQGQIETLLEGGTLEIQVHEEVTYGDMQASGESLWNSLYFTGYLTKKVRFPRFIDISTDVHPQCGSKDDLLEHDSGVVPVEDREAEFPGSVPGHGGWGRGKLLPRVPGRNPESEPGLSGEVQPGVGQWPFGYLCKEPVPAGESVCPGIKGLEQHP